MPIYANERAIWEAAAVGFLLKISGQQSFEDTARLACAMADALILEQRKRQWV